MLNYFNLRTDSFGWPIEWVDGRPIFSFIRHCVQLVRKWLFI